jgi:hypothetical protein
VTYSPVLKIIHKQIKKREKIILPASFIGSPRFMKALFEDSMALVVKYGKPDLFITITFNKFWKEVT